VRITALLALAVVITAATWLGGWWTVPVCAAFFAMLRRGATGVPVDAAMAAMLSWGALLLYQASHPAFGPLTAAVRGAIPLPAALLMLVTVVFAGLLAAAAAAAVGDR
jgi:uncharacterized membrane protein